MNSPVLHLGALRTGSLRTSSLFGPPSRASQAAPAAHPRPGRGTRLTRTSVGFAYSAAPGGGTFNHPWRPFLSGNSLRFTLGTVESFVPMIGKQPMDGVNSRTPPALKLSPGMANLDGESWAVLEVEPDDKGHLTKKSRLEIVHQRQLELHELKVGRQPLALILWKKNKPLRAIALVHFHLRYERLQPAPGGGEVRHYFL